MGDRVRSQNMLWLHWYFWQCEQFRGCNQRSGDIVRSISCQYFVYAHFQFNWLDIFSAYTTNNGIVTMARHLFARTHHQYTTLTSNWNLNNKSEKLKAAQNCHKARNGLAWKYSENPVNWCVRGHTEFSTKHKNSLISNILVSSSLFAVAFLCLLSFFFGFLPGDQW